MVLLMVLLVLVSILLWMAVLSDRKLTRQVEAILEQAKKQKDVT